MWHGHRSPGAVVVVNRFRAGQCVAGNKFPGVIELRLGPAGRVHRVPRASTEEDLFPECDDAKAAIPGSRPVGPDFSFTREPAQEKSIATYPVGSQTVDAPGLRRSNS